MNAWRQLPAPLQMSGDAWHRQCTVRCGGCDKPQGVTVYTDEPLPDPECDRRADQLLRQFGWTVTDDGDLCPDCAPEVVG